MTIREDAEREDKHFNYPVLRYFAYVHLPPHLASVSMHFYELAHKLAELDSNRAETRVALRKLLEAKDAAVRATLP